MKRSNVDLSFYPIVDLAFVRAPELEEKVTAVLSAGATIVQLRAKHAPVADFLEAGRTVKHLCASRGVPFMVNDRVDVCLAVGADGVHLGQMDFPVSEARGLLGPRALIGLSVQTVEQAETANALPLDYLSLGAVFATSTKDEVVVGPHLIARIKECTRLPLVAIGGIDAENARQAVELGADGICVISALWRAGDVGAYARRLVDAVAAGRRARSGSQLRGPHTR